MGIYCYTLRKNTIKAIDMDIGAPIELGTTQVHRLTTRVPRPRIPRATARLRTRARIPAPAALLAASTKKGL